jgi:hypothetical protein
MYYYTIARYILSLYYKLNSKFFYVQEIHFPTFQHQNDKSLTIPNNSTFVIVYLYILFITKNIYIIDFVCWQLILYS